MHINYPDVSCVHAMLEWVQVALNNKPIPGIDRRLKQDVSLDEAFAAALLLFSAKIQSLRIVPGLTFHGCRLENIIAIHLTLRTVQG